MIVQREKEEQGMVPDWLEPREHETRLGWRQFDMKDKRA